MQLNRLWKNVEFLDIPLRSEILLKQLVRTSDLGIIVIYNDNPRLNFGYVKKNVFNVM